MFNFSSKNSSFAKISFKLLIIIYLLFLSASLVSAPTVAYFTDEQTVESTISIADEFEEKDFEMVDSTVCSSVKYATVESTISIADEQTVESTISIADEFEEKDFGTEQNDVEA